VLELCGKDHAFMPSKCMLFPADFAAEAEKAKTASVEEARDYLLAMLKAKGQLAQTEPIERLMNMSHATAAHDQ
jgi:heme/copper-type cytochrome/quinol oxidase subunit 2